LATDTTNFKFSLTTSPSNKKLHLSKPSWLKTNLASAVDYHQLKNKLSKHHLHTICESGNCPNRAECWNRGTATFMILGNVCTRSCKFCSVETGKPTPVDELEPLNVAKVVQEMKLNHVVLTSVTRDDLPDGGAGIWAQTIIQIRNLNPSITIETLIPDFDADLEKLKIVLNVKPEIVSHNMETVRRTTNSIRTKATYDKSLQVIRIISDHGLVSKSGIMVGLGETDDEVFETILDLEKANCKILTIGQYLQPTKKHHPVQRYITPEMFKNYKEFALNHHFSHVESSPLVRSSYHSELQLNLPIT